VSDGVASLSVNAIVGTNYLVTDGDSVTAQLTRAETPTQSWLGRRWACFGDSITYKAPGSTAKRYFDYVAADLGLSVVNYGRATTGYGNSGSVTDGEYYKRMANIAPDSFDFMTIMGSTNDVGPIARGEIQLGTYTDTGTTTVCGCINTTIDKFYELAPFKRLGVMTMLPTYAYGPDLINTEVAENYVNELIKICKNRGIPCLDLYHGSGLRSWDAATRAAFFSDGDGIHPNDDGAAFIAPTIREFVKSLV
jgi:lysophospholipase L1-like esterase